MILSHVPAFMERRDFLAKLGVGAAAVLTIGCLHSCSKDDDAVVDFTLDLNDPANAVLQNIGGFVIKNDVIVARTVDGTYAAATVICSHANNKRIRYSEFANEWQCDVHGARFQMNGRGINSNASRGLRIFQIELVDGNILRVFS